MLLIYPPLAKPCEAPAGIAKLAGALRSNNHPCTLIDCNLEGILHLLSQPPVQHDTWSKRAWKNKDRNLEALRSPSLYSRPARYAQAVAEINRLLENQGKTRGLALSLSNYQDEKLSPVKSDHLLRAAENFEDNIFFPYFSRRLEQLLEVNGTTLVGLSLNYLSQALTCFAIIGFLKYLTKDLTIVLGGGLLTTWMRNPAWTNPFDGLVDHPISGTGEKPLLHLLDMEHTGHTPPDYHGLPMEDYLAAGIVLPYAASTGCYWQKCSFCPEKAEKNPYNAIPPTQVITEVTTLCEDRQPALIHYLDNAMSPALLRAIADSGHTHPWYGFARISQLLTDRDFCKRLRDSGCRMLKLGIESGSQTVLESMRKGTQLHMVSKTLEALHENSIATYVYLLFGTPTEGPEEARATMEFVKKHHGKITFLNLAIFNMPICSNEEMATGRASFYEGDLSIYTDFNHPRGWDRQNIRRFLDQEFKRDPRIAQILRRDPPSFTSNHAAFFSLPD